jgi:hypothetical protein
VGNHIVPYDPDTGQNERNAKGATTPAGHVVVSPTLLFFFAILGAVVTVSDIVLKSTLGKWIPGIEPALGYVLAFSLLIGAAIFAWHLILWCWNRMRSVDPGLLRLFNLVVVMLMLPLLGYIGYQVTERAGRYAEEEMHSQAPSLACPGESSTVLNDNRYPDGQFILPGDSVKLSFVLQNTGTVEWQNRYLQRWGKHDDPGQLRSEARIPITITPRKKQTTVRIWVHAPREPNTYTAYFKLINEKGEFCYPMADPLEASFTVLGQSDLEKMRADHTATGRSRTRARTVPESH